MDSSAECFSGWVPKSIHLGAPNKGELSTDLISEMKALSVRSATFQSRSATSQVKVQEGTPYYHVLSDIYVNQPLHITFLKTESYKFFKFIKNPEDVASALTSNKI